jgi:hypothetical protein
MSKPALNGESRGYSERFLCTILAQIYLIPKSSVSIKRTVCRFMFTSSATILTVKLLPDRTSSLTRAGRHLFVLLKLIRCAAHLPFGFCLQKTLCASDMPVLFTLHHIQRPCFTCLVEALSPSLTQKIWHIFRCAMFRASIFVTRFTNTS